VKKDSAVLLDHIQSGFPVEERPFKAIGDLSGLSEDDVVAAVGDLIAGGIVRQIGPFFDSKRLGFKSTLIAARVDPECADEAAAYISRFSEVTHNYQRAHEYNIWFTLIARSEARIEEILSLVNAGKGVLGLQNLPARKMFKIKVDFSVSGREKRHGDLRPAQGEPLELQERDKLLIKAVQQGIPIEKTPFDKVASSIGEEQAWVIEKLGEWIEKGVIRRFGAALRHHGAGFVHNAMVVWSVPAEDEERIGRLFAAESSVSHCYLRPVFPGFPWSLYTMLHSQTEEGLAQAIERLRQESFISDFLILKSVKEYKKTSPHYF
jgi:DNA-binding Lrp family transcriptional regulator